ncbi:MAG: regulatory iron-sulfur-containing complex subunit RicT [Desulfuromonas sp.]|nr:regulatory iron-sulfur-containing complex subunit RicT [Desulfuromonas sp.]
MTQNEKNTPPANEQTESDATTAASPASAPDQDSSPNPAGKMLVTIKFRNAGKQYDFDTAEFDLTLGDEVVVETNKGKALGTVARSPRFVEKAQLPADLKPIIRLASDADINMARISSAKESEAHEYCLLRIRQRKMDMKLVKAEYLFDGSKIIFYFTADGRVDFRELVKDLAQYFHTRIEMRQIGVRDEAKLLGGIGICGRELCCGTFLTDFNPVSVRMAKQQGLALNPTKISGQCGRLLCCLGYEYDTYCKMSKQLPKQGTKLTLDGKTAEVLSCQTLAQTVTVRCEGSVVSNIPLAQLKAGKLQAPKTENTSDDSDNSFDQENKAAATMPNQRNNRRNPSSAGAKGKKNEQRTSRPKRNAPGTNVATNRGTPEQANNNTPANNPSSAPANSGSTKPKGRDEVAAGGGKTRPKNNRRPQRHKKPSTNKPSGNESGDSNQQQKPAQEVKKQQKTPRNPARVRSNQPPKKQQGNPSGADKTPNVKTQDNTTNGDNTNPPSKRRNRNRRKPVRKP